MSSSEWTTYSIGEIAEIHNARRVPISSRARENRQGIFPYYGASGIVDYIDDSTLAKNSQSRSNKIASFKLRIMHI
ncbi:MAG: hypothetical protein GY796_26425 [Chloroflexi bacterium]|nr:hypothetical protein [Chloroflexota bacterium]